LLCRANANAKADADDDTRPEMGRVVVVVVVVVQELRCARDLHEGYFRAVAVISVV
jgi:hypothetical protein